MACLCVRETLTGPQDIRRARGGLEWGWVCRAVVAASLARLRIPGPSLHPAPPDPARSDPAVLD